MAMRTTIVFAAFVAVLSMLTCTGLVSATGTQTFQDMELSSVTLSSQYSGAHFENVRFTDSVTFDMNLLDNNSARFSLTFENCTFSDQGIVFGNDNAATTLSVTNSVFDLGTLTIDGSFASASAVTVAYSTFRSPSFDLLLFASGFSIGSSSSILISFNNFYPLNFFTTVTSIRFEKHANLIASTFVVSNCTFEILENSAESSLIQVGEISLSQQSSFALVNNTATGVTFLRVVRKSSLDGGLLLLSGNKFTGTVPIASLFACNSEIYIGNFSEMRIEKSVSSGASLLKMIYGINFVIDVQNAKLSIRQNTLSIENSLTVPVLTLGEWIFLDKDDVPNVYSGCNTVNGKPTQLIFIPNASTDYECDSCADVGQCYTPTTYQFDGALTCSCICNPGFGFGKYCYPFTIPTMTAPPKTTTNPDESRDCVQDVTLTSSSLSLWATNFCYKNVVFSGTNSSLIFKFSDMPTYLQINIILTGCTFSNGATLVLEGTSTLTSKSAGVTLIATDTQLSNGCFAMLYGQPQNLSISISNVVSSQTSPINLPPLQLASNYGILVGAMVSLENSKIIVNGVTANAQSQGGAVFAFIEVAGPQKFSSNSLIHLHNCTASNYDLLVKIGTSTLLDQMSVLSLTNNVMNGNGMVVRFLEGFTMSTRSVLQVIGNTLNSRATAPLVAFVGTFSITKDAWFVIRGNYQPTGPIIDMSSDNTFLSMSGTATLTVTENTGNAIMAPGMSTLVKTADISFVIGCLNIAGKPVTTAEDIHKNGIPFFTEVADCTACTAKVDCYMPLTNSFTQDTCTCNCVTDGHGSSCLPVNDPITGITIIEPNLHVAESASSLAALGMSSVLAVFVALLATL